MSRLSGSEVNERGPALLVPLGSVSFRRFWAGASLSMLADQALLVSLTWLVVRTTDSGTALGFVLAVASIPGIVLTPLGGVLSDRLPPTYVMSVVSVARAALMGVLAILVLTDATRIWHVYLLAGGLSALDALYYPASLSVAPTLLDPDRLKAANALTQGVEQISGVLGPASAGLLLALFGLWAGLGVNAVLFLISALIFAAVTRAVPPATNNSQEADEGETAHVEDADTLSALLEGARYVWGDPVIRTIMLILVGINLSMAGPVYVGGSLLAETRLGGAGAFGTLIAAAGAGALVGAVLAGSLGRMRRRGLIQLASTAVIGVGVGGFAFAPNLLVVVLLSAVVGMTASFMAVVNISWLQELSRPGLTSRVMSLAMFSTIALDPISYMLAGAIVELSLPAVFLAAAGLLLLTAVLGATSRTMRTAD
ncbi:MAG: MFS transporter [Actinomycetota bacterium]|nr:MFS transporter [Actinomycetota bacterium]